MNQPCMRVEEEVHVEPRGVPIPFLRKKTQIMAGKMPNLVVVPDSLVRQHLRQNQIKEVHKSGE